MEPNQRELIPHDLLGVQTDPLTRRRLLRILSGLATAVAATAVVGRAAGQEATPGVEPMVTPQLGEQPDGTRVWRVQVAGGSMEDEIELMAYFPAELTVNAGDAVWFDFAHGMPEIPHSVIFPVGQPVPEGIVPESSLDAPDAATPAAEPDRAIFNPAAVFPSGGDIVDGSDMVNSGLDILRDPDSPFIVTFPTPGTYDFQDLFFGTVMTGQIVVQEEGAALAREQAEIDQAATEEQEQLLERGRALIAEHGQAEATTQDDGTQVWAVLAGLTEGQIEIAAFLPRELEITAGDTVRWTTERTDLEVHTATFVGGAEPPELLLVEPQEDGPPLLVINPELIAPAGGPTYQGEGFANTGFLSTAFPGFPAAEELTFGAAGDYPYYCALHGTPTSGMRGTITAT